MTRFLRRAAALALPALLACSTPPAPPPPPRESCTLQLRGLPDLNLNDLGEPTPVDLRIYRLKDPVKFRQASFDELWTKDQDLLGASAVGAPQVLTVLPGLADAPPAKVPLQLEGATWVGLMALFSAEQQQGLEERKVLVHVDQVDGKIFELTGHRIAVNGRSVAEVLPGSTDPGAPPPAAPPGGAPPPDAAPPPGNPPPGR